MKNTKIKIILFILFFFLVIQFAFASVNSTDETDLKILSGNTWNWISFPRLADNFGVDGIQLFEEIKPFPIAIDLWRTYFMELSYDMFWCPPKYAINSEQSYKIHLYQDGVYELECKGSRLSPEHTITLNQGMINPVGYWLHQTQLWSEAITSTDLEKINYIQAQDWFVVKRNGKWYGVLDATFEYGKGYEISVSQTIKSFQWQQSGNQFPVFKKEPVKYFDYKDKPVYEMVVIDGIESDTELREIGIFIDNVCIGAEKINGYPISIQAYTQYTNHQHPLDFITITEDGIQKAVRQIWRYSFEKERYKISEIYPHKSHFTKLKLSLNDDNSAKPIAELSIISYPNPFNPSTTISFTLAEETEITLEIYNIKGQKVATLINGNLRTGKQEIVWNGVDENGVFVSSGIYFSRLTVGEKKLLQKMMLLK
jgi:hypothetical protein